MAGLAATVPQYQDNVKNIYTTLKREILNLTIPPGTVISESEICARFSVSRTPVRSVFQRLSDMRLIEIVPYRETRVSLINLHQIKQMIYMRIAIESKVVRDFIDLNNRLLVEKLRYFLRKQRLLLNTGFTPQDFYNEDSAFHRIWFSAMNMDFLWRKIQHAQAHYTRFRMLDIVGTRNFEAIIKEHEKIFSIVDRKKKDEVEPFFTKHFNGGIQRLGKRIYTEYTGYFEKEGNNA
jgi:DNA-binding GntR family transcriptional regulator